MRTHLPETTLRLIADTIASTVTVRTYVNGSSRDIRQVPTEKQRQAIKTAAYAGLLGLNWGDANRSDKGREDAILNTTEFMLIVADTGSDEVNGYDTIYNPLKATIEAWRLASERTRNGSYTDVFAGQFQSMFQDLYDLIDHFMDYAQDEEYGPLFTLEDAQVNLEGWQECGALDDIPEEQQDAGLIYLLWNMYITEHPEQMEAALRAYNGTQA